MMFKIGTSPHHPVAYTYHIGDRYVCPWFYMSDLQGGMSTMSLVRREFLKVGAGACALCLAGGRILGGSAVAAPTLISPGCRKNKVKIAKIYLGHPKAHWPTPTMDINAEKQRYEDEFTRMADQFADVEFVVSDLVTSKEQAEAIKGKLESADGVMVIHLSMGVHDMLQTILDAGKPTFLFAAPYSGHEWTLFGSMQKERKGQLDVVLSSDFNQLAEGIHPFRAIHHLREAKILNVTERVPETEFLEKVKNQFGTTVVPVNLARMMGVFDSIPDSDVETETEQWMTGALEVVEPPREEVFRSCKLALAFEKLMEEEEATVITADCYGTMYHKLPAFPCIGFTRLNDMGLAGICESDLESALTFVLFQGLCGRPGFISDPTMDGDSIILAHCLGTRKMDGPGGEAAPYKLRTIMERQEGAVPQVFMRVGEKVTQARLVGTDLVLCFTGEILDAPDLDRGCRTKITVKVDGDPQSLWQNWSNGLHRVTCYGNISKDLKRFCGYKGIKFVDEAARV